MSVTTTTTLTPTTTPPVIRLPPRFVLPNEVIAMAYIGLIFFIGNFILAIYRVYVDQYKAKLKNTYRHWLGLFSVCWLGVYNVAFFYCAMNPMQLLLNRQVYIALVLASVCSCGCFDMMSLLKYISIVKNPTTRRRVEIAMWIVQIIHMGLTAAFGIIDALRAATLPPKYGPAFNWLGILYVLEPIVVGVGYFGVQIFLQIRSSVSNKSSGKKLKRLATVTTLFTVLSTIAWIIVFFAVMFLSGTLLLTPTVCTFLNVIAFSENGGDLITRRYVRESETSRPSSQKKSATRDSSVKNRSETQGASGVSSEQSV